MKRVPEIIGITCVLIGVIMLIAAEVPLMLVGAAGIFGILLVLAAARGGRG